jgi:hypothetical protein
MRNLALCYAALAMAMMAAVEEFNGRWDLKASNESRNRAWWLEVEGAGTPALKGRFVGFPGGDTNVIEDIRLSGDELIFTFTREPRGNQKQRIHQEYRARLKGKNQIEGWMQSGSTKLNFTGARAPEIKDKDDGSWKPGKPVELFNGKDLSGWLPLVKGQELGWSVADGIMNNVARANNLVSEQKFWNFLLHVEYRIGKGSNSGIGLRGRYEVQILDDYGRPPNNHGNGALYSRILPVMNASLPPGEWQTLDVRLVGRDVTITLNGKKIIDKGYIDGLTAIASDPHEAEPGPFIIQGDHGPVDIRKFTVTPLRK